MNRLILIILVLAFSASAQRGNRRLMMANNPAAAGGGGGQTVTDDFNRANNADLGANWTTVTGDTAWNISGNTAVPANLTLDCGERYSGVTWADNQSSEAKVTVNDNVAGAGVGLYVRAAAAAQTYYRLMINSDGEWELAKVVAGSFTSLATGTTTYSAGAVLKLSASGTTITSTYNGAQIDSRTDSSIASGSPGIGSSGPITSGSLDDWVGKEL